MGAVQSRQGNYEQARSFYDEALKISRDHGIKTIKAACLANIGNLHYFQGQLDQAHKAYTDSYQMLSQLGDPSGIASVQMNLGTIEQMRGNRRAGLQSFQIAADAFLKLNDRNKYAFARINICTALAELGQTDEAIEIANDTRKLANETNLPLVEADACYCLGMTLYQKEALEEADECFERALNISESSGNSRNVSKVETALAIRAYFSEDYDEAKRHADAGLAVSKKLSSKNHVIVTEAILAALTVRDGLYNAGLRRLRQLRNEAAEILDKKISITVDTILGEVQMSQAHSATDIGEGRRMLQEAQALAESLSLNPEVLRVASLLGG